MDIELYTRFLMALIGVLALIGLLAWLARRFGLGGKLVASKSRTRRLAIVEVMALDARRKLVLLRRDDREHLMLLGPNGDLLVEQGISAQAGGEPFTGPSSAAPSALAPADANQRLPR